ncbi:unnamed protein product, partial [Choristocarpus tenellus]
LHIWSDGCGSQFKKRWQMWWVSQSSARMGIPLVHNFFASCHSKSLPDGVGAVVKSAARRLELHGVRMPGTLSLVDTIKATKTQYTLRDPTPEEEWHYCKSHKVPPGQTIVTTVGTL